MTNNTINQVMVKINEDQLAECTVCVNIQKHADHCLECREAIVYLTEGHATATEEFKASCLYCSESLIVEPGELQTCMTCSGHLNDDPDFETYDQAWERQKQGVKTSPYVSVNTARQPVLITTREKALKMIKATAYSEQVDTHEELKEYSELQRVAMHYGIDTDELIISASESQADHDNGWPYIYTWKNEEEPAIERAIEFEEEERDRDMRAIAQAQSTEGVQAVPAPGWENTKDCAVCNKTITSEEAWDYNDCCENCYREMTGE